MKDSSDITALIVDSGLFLPLADRLSEEYKRVLYWSPDQRAYPSVRQSCIGDGFDNIERINHWAPYLKEVDLVVFPDVNQGELQAHFRELGKPVWGSGDGEVLELDRLFFLKKLKELGLDVPEYEVLEGWSALADHLKDNEDLYIKVSKFRGDFETKHWRSWLRDEDWLYSVALRFGPVKEHITFLVFAPIETDLEIGGDTYNVNGQWPKTMLHGIEGKDKSYFAAVTDTTEMPEQIQAVMEAFNPVLGEYGYTNQWSMEVRIVDDKAFFIDATCRGGMPSSASQQVLWKNLPEIIWAGAHGELVEPDEAAQFSIECMITSSCDQELSDAVDLDPELKGWARLSHCCRIGQNTYGWFPDETRHNELGWLVAIGGTPRETLERIKELADLLPSELNADVEALAPVIEEIESEQKQGIEFTEQELPAKEEVL